MNDGGTEYLTYHYYDGNANGAPTLQISHLTWNGTTPINAPDWISNGTYKIVNAGNGLAWDAWGCTGVNFQAIAQNTYTGLNCQKWVFATQGNGEYKITCLVGGRCAEVLNCNAANGGKLDLYDSNNLSCQRWHVERSSNGTYVLSSLNGNRVVDVPNGTTATGTQL